MSDTANKVTVSPLSELPTEQLRAMLAAGHEVQECLRVLKKANLNVVGELLKGQGEFVRFDHYPKGDVFDNETGSQYYYHAHRGLPGENGHFHTFVRGNGIPANLTPVANKGEVKWPQGDQTVTHFIAISMDKYGFPIGLFATNRWVTDEAWFKASDLVSMLSGFEIDHAYPSWPTNRWISSIFRLFLPEIEALLLHRDEVVERWRVEHPKRDVFEDRKLEVTGDIRISTKRRIETLNKLLA